MKILYIYSNRQNSMSIEKKARKFCDLLNSQSSQASLCNVSKLNMFEVFLLILRLSDFDCIYLRDNFDPFCYFIALFFPKKITLECNRPIFYTYGSKSTTFQYLRNICNRIFYMRIRKFNCVTIEIANSVKKSVSPKAKVISLGNVHGYLGREYVKPISSRNKQYDFVFLGNLNQPWQGKSRIFDCLHNNKDCKLLILGDTVTIPPEITEQVTQKGIVTDPSDISRLLRKAKIGLSAMDMSKRRQKFVSALKHADYVAAGIPIVASAIDTFLIDKYAYKVISQDDDLLPPVEDVYTTAQEQLDVKISAEQQFKGFIQWLKP